MNWYLVEMKIALQLKGAMQYTMKKEVVEANNPRKAINKVLEDFGEFNGWDLIDIKKL